jgi:hypothetical protein
MLACKGKATQLYGSIVQLANLDPVGSLMTLKTVVEERRLNDPEIQPNVYSEQLTFN